MPRFDTFAIRTPERDALVDITADVQQSVQRLGGRFHGGLVHVFVPHTTAGVTLNENADPDVKADMLEQLRRMVPWDQPFHRHAEGNSAAHVKASMVGSSVTVAVDARRKLQLGTWQGIQFAEFDGPRTRQVHVTLLPGHNDEGADG